MHVASICTYHNAYNIHRPTCMHAIGCHAVGNSCVWGHRHAMAWSSSIRRSVGQIDSWCCGHPPMQPAGWLACDRDVHQLIPCTCAYYYIALLVSWLASQCKISSTIASRWWKPCTQAISHVFQCCTLEEQCGYKVIGEWALYSTAVYVPANVTL